jgi:uncharacterized membrane protein
VHVCVCVGGGGCTRTFGTLTTFFHSLLIPFFLSLNIAAFDSDVVEIAKNDTQDFLGVLDEILKAATRNYFTTTASGAPEI